MLEMVWLFFGGREVIGKYWVAKWNNIFWPCVEVLWMSLKKSKI